MGFPAQPAESTRALVLAREGQLGPHPSTLVDLEAHRVYDVKLP